MAIPAKAPSALEESPASQLTLPSRQEADLNDPPGFALWMASSEVDQKFLGHFAKTTSLDNPYLSSMLYKVLGLSVVLSEKLLRARNRRRLDPTRDTKSVQQYHHILWLSREGLVIVEQYILPMVGNYIELKVLSYKLRASFYHIFVLYHNQPSVNKAAGPFTLFPSPLTPRASNGNKGKLPENRNSIMPSPPGHRRAVIGGSVSTGPPGLPPLAPVANPSGSFLLPSIDYIPTATSCFATANAFAEGLLPGSHPVRLSVKVEFVAYVYGCLHDGAQSRQMAKGAIADVYKAQEGMDDESFEDAAELVEILGRMMKRGLGGGSGSGSTTHGAGGGSGSGGRGGGAASGSQESRSTPRMPEQHSQRNPTSPPRTSNGIPPAVPSPGMTNPI